MNSCYDYWAKGAKLVNDLLRVLFRFRENKVVICGDIRKMYHSEKSKYSGPTHPLISLGEYGDPDLYVMTAVSALHKTAEMGKQLYPTAKECLCG